MFALFQSALVSALNPLTLALIFGGVIIGIIFGAVPGLTAVMAIALFLPVTYGLGPTNGMALLMALYIGAVSGGLISAILLRIPGTPASIATCFDGHPLADKGQAYKALGVGTVFSFIGTIISIAILVFVSPALAKIALKFSPFEYFSVAIFSLTMISGLSGKSLTKGLISCVFGFMMVTVGVAPIDAVSRFTFGISSMRSGFDILTVLVGLYAISEVLATASNKKALATEKVREFKRNRKGYGFSIKEFVGQLGNGIRSALIGVGIGILPGIGGATSNILAYTVAKNADKNPERFGTGVIDGLVASEAANNASIGGAMIPMMVLGIPGDAATAMLLGGLIIHGITPGPLLFTTNGSTVYFIFAAMILAAIVMLLVQMVGLRIFSKILAVPKYYLMPIIIVLCVVGAFGLNNRIFDVWGILVFGVIGYTMSKLNMPLPPMILGFVLGGIVEMNLRRGLMYSNGSLLPFFTNPISCVFLIASLLSILFTVYKNRQRIK